MKNAKIKNAKFCVIFKHCEIGVKNHVKQKKNCVALLLTLDITSSNLQDRREMTKCSRNKKLLVNS